MDSSNSKTNTLKISPPKLVPTIVSGFNIVANNVLLILFPVVMDLFLWLGPRARVKTLLEPLVNDLIKSLNEISTAEVSGLIKVVETMWQVTLERYNLFSTLRTYPIGIPSLFASAGSMKTPLGNAGIFEMSSFSGVVIGWIIISLTGIMLGSIYFNEIARSSREKRQTDSLISVCKKFLQIVLFTFVILLFLLIISIPVSIILTVAAMINPILSQIALMLITLVILWLIFPLVFSPHGVFIFEHNIFISMLNSVRMVRYFLPGTGFFVLTAILISQGMDILWRMGPETSWIALVGIFGHAFITTSLLAASFVYYLGGVKWMEENLQRIAAANQAKI